MLRVALPVPPLAAAFFQSGVRAGQPGDALRAWASFVDDVPVAEVVEMAGATLGLRMQFAGQEKSM